MNASTDREASSWKIRFGFGLFRTLAQDWLHLSRDPRVNEITALWSAESPALAGLTTLTSIEEARDKRQVEDVDAMFGALMLRTRRPGSEGELATRILLQLMLPKAAALCARYRDLVPDPEERAHIAITCLWTAIKQHPEQFTNYLPPRLGWRAHSLMRREVLVGINETPMGEIRGITRDEMIGEELRSDLHPSEELTLLLIWAVSQKVIKPAEAELLGTLYGSEAPPTKKRWRTIGEPPSSVRGLSRDAMYQRVSRAKRKIALAVADYNAEAA